MIELIAVAVPEDRRNADDASGEGDTDTSGALKDQPDPTGITRYDTGSRILKSKDAR